MYERPCKDKQKSWKATKKGVKNLDLSKKLHIFAA
jgi:hypothetical protein